MSRPFPAPRATWFPKWRSSPEFPCGWSIPPEFAKPRELIERLGIERSFQAMSDADLTLVVVDGSAARSAEDQAL